MKPSWSKLAAWWRCRRFFFYKHVVGLPEGERAATLRGAELHKAAVEMLLGKREVREGDDGALRTVAELLVGREGADGAREGVWVVPGSVEARCRRGRIDLCSETTPVPEGGLGDGGMLRLGGWVPGRCVVDLKFPAPGKAGRARDPRQLVLYCLDTGVDRGAFIQIPDGVDAAGVGRVLVQNVDISGERERWTRYFADEWRAVEAAVGDALGGGDGALARGEARFDVTGAGTWLCDPRWCAYWDRCPGGGAGRPATRSGSPVTWTPTWRLER